GRTGVRRSGRAGPAVRRGTGGAGCGRHEPHPTRRPRSLAGVRRRGITLAPAPPLLLLAHAGGHLPGNPDAYSSRSPVQSSGPADSSLREEGSGVNSLTATGADHTSRILLRLRRIRSYAHLARSGFRRWATYRQATVAGAVTNTVFGFVRCYVLLAVAAGAGGVAAGYDAAQLATYVWFGQGLLAVVLLWGWTDLADRIRTGEVATDLLRPVSPIASYLATDLGRAGYALLGRFLPPTLVGLVCFELYLPSRPATWPLFAVSTVLAVLVCFGCRYLVNAAAYWLLDARGVMAAWTVGSGAL